MKKMVLNVVAILAFGLSTIAQVNGRIKITLVGAQCNKETWDDILQLDGKSDEVFFNFGFMMSDVNGNSKFHYQKRTGVYGDNAGIFGNRINAGSAVDLFGNLRGGIKGGDNFNCNVLMGEYDMDANDVLTITPSIWEWDGGTDMLTTFTNILSPLTTSLSRAITQQANRILSAGNLSNFVIKGDFFSLPSFSNVFASIFGKAGDRPIGMTSNGSYEPKLVLLKSSFIQTIINSNFGYGLGVVPVDFNEEALGNTRDHGNYTILIKIEFTPKSSVVIVPPPPPSPNTPITAIWEGSWGNGNNDGPNYYSFKLNSNYTMQLLDGNGGVIANGTYTFSDNSLNAIYKYGDGSQYSAFGTVNGTSINGTWGSGTNVMNGGRWKMAVKSAANPVGHWIGTWGSGSSDSPNYYSFKLNSDATMKLLDATGRTIGEGLYTIKDNVLLTSYKYGDGSLYSATATINGTSMKGTWGSGDNVTNGGSWKMSKN